ncbi:MAG: 3-oxoadipyl-CoA thiolase [Pseudomonadota bacterium]
MTDAFLCDGVRTPIGRYGGALASVRADDLAAVPLAALANRNASFDPAALDDLILGCANQAGEDNRNVARMAALLAGYGDRVPGTTINRLCGSGMDAVTLAARAIKAGEASMIVAGGVESMSRAPFVMGKADKPFARDAQMFDTTIGWRFVNPLLKAQYGIDSMPETAETVAEEFDISRDDQDAFALRSQNRAAKAQASGRFDCEITPVAVAQRRADPLIVDRDEHPRASTLQTLATLKPFVKSDGVITAGNASGVNDGAAAMIVADEAAAARHGLTPRARFVCGAVVGVPPRIMGIGPAPAAEAALAKAGLTITDMDVVEINEAFAAQSLASLRQLGLPDDAEHVNPNGGAIALGHPLGMSGARLILTATHELHQREARYALCAMCIGVGQGIAVILERVA